MVEPIRIKFAECIGQYTLILDSPGDGARLIGTSVAVWVSLTWGSDSVTRRL